MRLMIDWDDIRYFLAVARRGSITSAARDLGVNHSTVSRRIAAFEDNLGVRLFDRVATGYNLTPAGQEMVPSAQRMEEEALGLDRRLYGRDTELGGVLRVTTAGTFVNPFLMEQIGRFLAEYPGIDIDLVVSTDLANLHAREVDVAIRATLNPPDTLVGRRIGRLAAMLYGRHDFIAPGEPGATSASAAPDVIAFEGSGRDYTDASWFSDVYPNARTRVRLNNVEAAYHGILSGVGIGMLPCHVGDISPELRRLPPYHLEPVFDLWLLTHADLRRTAKVRAFINFMANAIMPHKDLIEGKRPPGFSSGDRLAVDSGYAAAAGMSQDVPEDVSA
ncbi:LysR family transcriptional regulator [Emcibacter sp. SYSU 3D8]|uniref:LysR family transcriptional regulator n=1 Tax=Emcibacter sp. SYSU 3D8 TaxID=3133969 RepID=UPI0031FEB0A1